MCLYFVVHLKIVQNIVKVLTSRFILSKAQLIEKGK